MDDGVSRLFGDDECLALLRSSNVARVALSRQALPVVEPVHYRLVDDRIVIAGGHLESIEPTVEEPRVVCFEVDGESLDGDVRWVVQVVGLLDRAGADLELPLAAAIMSGRVWSTGIDRLAGAREATPRTVDG